MNINGMRELFNSGNSVEETIHSTFDKIERSKLNAFITLSKEIALEEARILDKNGAKGMLGGIPIGIKDSISTKGIQTTCGSKILEGYVPPYDAHVIERLKLEGAIIIGKTNMDEFAMGTSTETSYFGPTRNPWDLKRVPGGSSGGSAAAVAGGEAPIALGSDTGGSVRCPASFCGVVGLKPTYGLVSRYGLIAYANSLEQIGPFARNVKDVALLLDVIAGYDSKDSTSINEKCEYLKALRYDVSDVKIGVPKEYFGEGIDEDVEKAVWKGIKTLEDMGASYTEISLKHTKYSLAAYYIIAMSEASSNLARFDGLRYGLRLEKDKDWHNTFSEIKAQGFGEEVKRRILLGTYALSAGYYGKYYLKALKVRTLIKRDFESALKDTSVLITPTMPFPAFKIGEKIGDPLALYLADVNTVPINLAGVPSISVPCGFSGKLPIGMQIIGRHFDEATVLRTAYAFEQGGGCDT
ncbi:MAG: Asp-tRNA(Asn)/Glu-tRNA(Gln) amidotransferase subunit GatA [Methanocellales archaeon]|nr:Asp-tRNA(Asn)/Glu-tRNA(Gln) amidotransferase subunit GatA [Methanocellales archaeon]